MSGDTKPTVFGASSYEQASPADVSFHVGTILAEKYRVESVLGVGGMGVVLAVRHLGLNERYAMKCLLPKSAKDPEQVQRFVREAKAAARIKSEHVVHVTDVGQLESGAPYLLMEHLDGRDLSKLLDDGRRLPIAEAVEYVLHACTGIAEAHALGIVHRDLKPANMFLTQRRDGPALVKILDFGISKAMDEAPDAQLTQTQSVFGSPAYMSPEQIRSAKNVDARTDVWSLGVILYELLTGSLPFRAESSAGLLAAIAADEPTPMYAFRQDIPEELEAAIRRCLAKKVSERFQNVSELASALEPFTAANSLVSLGRIRRLSSAPDYPMPSSIPLTPRSSSLRAVAGSVTSTEVAVPPRRSSGPLAVMIAVVLLAAIGIVAILKLVPKRAPAAIVAVSAPPPPPVVTTAPLPSVVVTAAETHAPAPMPVMPAATKPRGKRAPAIASSSPPAPVAPPPSPLPAATATIGPLDESH